jgi:hypothetical protein
LSTCANCLEPGIHDYSTHDCPGPGEIVLTRELGRGLVVLSADRRSRITLELLANGTWGLDMCGPDLINIADQVLYQITGYDPESCALTLELVEDWRPVPHRQFSEAEAEAIKTRWRERYGKPGTCNHEPTEEQRP